MLNPTQDRPFNLTEFSRSLGWAEIVARSPSRTGTRSLLPEVDRAIILTHPAWRVHPVLPVATQEGLFLGTISYRTLKLLEEAEDKHQEKGSDAGTALGELYWLGLMALVRGAISSIKGKED